MKRLFRRLRSDRRGVGAVEFALIAPIFIMMIVGVAQMGILYYAHSALRNAVSEGARYATIYPRPTAAEIVTRINSNRATGGNGTYTTPTVVYQQDATTGNWRATIGMSYTTNLNFLFFTWPNVTLSYSRQAYVHAPPS
ncbi:MAG TPA: TadE/TadG family type IV pilus assembly protein [Allosphingosinicella sp.]|nr:TadE/TadG family type IV pilus assembly protein [Allosphingosinicella sp.]